MRHMRGSNSFLWVKKGRLNSGVKIWMRLDSQLHTTILGRWLKQYSIDVVLCIKLELHSPATFSSDIKTYKSKLHTTKNSLNNIQLQMKLYNVSFIDYLVTVSVDGISPQIDYGTATRRV